MENKEEIISEWKDLDLSLPFISLARKVTAVWPDVNYIIRESSGNCFHTCWDFDEDILGFDIKAVGLFEGRTAGNYSVGIYQQINVNGSRKENIFLDMHSNCHADFKERINMAERGVNFAHYLKTNNISYQFRKYPLLEFSKDLENKIENYSISLIKMKEFLK